ncbi:hypothetical protein ABENE_20675 [Asticcacaulis benevestitus DSM 16100 = ATCC BAA-896]|uniref:Transposase n=1 Tax=Asticcacaulis benevestitus DSM 16100 = ATCC BAA-896 TaxID=1121022 RepID=V4QUG3_9CAUL|nr:hypothetical protein ABENE_20675 [Asticcacaulis benevestitus DSM 16100 = ATCC BAA-896]
MARRVLKANNTKSQIRAHIEHVFAVQKHKMGLFVRTIGIKRAWLQHCLQHEEMGLARCPNCADITAIPR